MKAIKITNVNIVVNHFLKQEVWRNTSAEFMRTTKIRNVNLVVNLILKRIIWRNIFVQYTVTSNLSLIFVCLWVVLWNKIVYLLGLHLAMWSCATHFSLLAQDLSPQGSLHSLFKHACWFAHSLLLRQPVTENIGNKIIYTWIEKNLIKLEKPD